MRRSPLARLFLGPARSVPVQLFRYAAVGGVAFAADLGALVALTEAAGWHYLAAAAAGFGLGLATNYGLSVSWVFPTRSVRNRAGEFLIFAVLGVFGLGINELTLYLLTGCAGLHYAASKVVATVATFAWNFASRKVLLFLPARGEAPATETAPAEPADAVAV